MQSTTVPTSTKLDISYSLHMADRPTSDRLTVLQHGLCHSRYMFGQLMNELNEQGLHVAAVDQHTTRNWVGLSQYREGLAEALTYIQEQTQMRIGTICGHSMGALIVQEMMAKYPHLRDPTVLLAPVPLEGALPATMRTVSAHPKEYGRTFRRLRVKDALTADVVRTLFFDKRTPTHIWEDAAEHMTDTPYLAYLQLGPRWLRPTIKDTDQPTMLLRSNTDFLFRRGEYLSLRERYEQFEEKTIKRGGHDFFIEKAGEAAKHIADFHRKHTL